MWHIIKETFEWTKKGRKRERERERVKKGAPCTRMTHRRPKPNATFADLFFFILNTFAKVIILLFHIIKPLTRRISQNFLKKEGTVRWSKRERERERERERRNKLMSWKRAEKRCCERVKRMKSQNSFKLGGNKLAGLFRVFIKMYNTVFLTKLRKKQNLKWLYNPLQCWLTCTCWMHHVHENLHLLFIIIYLSLFVFLFWKKRTLSKKNIWLGCSSNDIFISFIIYYLN